MSDESQLQVTRKDEESALVLSSARSRLVARGRRDASLLAVPCNKCGERRELVLAGCVCASCTDALDKQWAGATANNWVLLTTFVDNWVLRTALDDAVGAYLYRDTAYIQMKSHWATCNPPFSFHIGPATADDLAQMRPHLVTRSKRSDTPTIRPATLEEIAEYDARQRKEQISDVEREIQEKWGLYGEVWDDDAWRRAKEAFQETEKRLEQLGLLEGSGFEYEDLSAKEAYLADQGDAADECLFGVRYANGQGVIQDYDEAARWWRKAADQKYACAYYNLGLMYANGHGVPLDYAKAARWYRKAADQRHDSAQYKLGLMYKNGQGVRLNYAKAVRWCRKAADQWHAGAQFTLGNMFADGEGVPQDYAEAVRWYLKAADQGHAGAQYNLGLRYRFGQGVAQDYAEAVRWWRKTADQEGYAPAQYNLGLSYDNGEGVAQDYAEAVRWYRKAADQGYASAQLNLGVIYNNGEGVPQDYEEAARWFRKAADHGNAIAQWWLGIMYDNGEGVPQDYVEAHRWLNLAASKAESADQAKVARARDLVAGKMTIQQIADAQRLARDWKPVDAPQE